MPLSPELRAFLIGFVPAAISAWPIYRALVAMKSRQTVSQHVAEHAHKQGTPTMGGLIILVGLLTYGVWELTQSSGPGTRLAGVLALVVGYSLIGFVDDYVIPKVMKGKRGLGWTQKLLLQIGFAALAVLLMQPTNTIALGLAIFSILFFANAFNFTDGMDWLASTVLVALAGGGAVLANMENMPGVTLLFCAVLGAVLPFMALNRPPAKLFMGDVGSMPIGGLLGLGFAATCLPAVAPGLARDPESLQSNAWPTWVGVIVISFVMLAELVPVPIQIASVKLRKKKVFPFTPIHHAFQRAGWKETRVVGLFFAVQLVCTLIALGVAVAFR